MDNRTRGNIWFPTAFYGLGRHVLYKKTTVSWQSLERPDYLLSVQMPDRLFSIKTLAYNL